MKNFTLLPALTVAAYMATALTSADVSAAVSISKDENCKSYAIGDKHAVATLFFGDNLKNIVATNNEYLEMDGFVFESAATNIRFDVFKANGDKAGECLGGINVTIDNNSNESVQFAIEDYIKNVEGNEIGLITRTGSTGVLKKFDLFVDVMADGKRSVIWNNFIGLPNKSAEMSPMRFYAGHHLMINYSGSDPAGSKAHVQVFKNDGSFVGVASVMTGPQSVVVTDAVRSLQYKDADGNPVASSDLPDDGMGYIKVLGLTDKESQRATGNLYTAASPNSVDDAKFDHTALSRGTITWSRRNGGHGRLKIGQ